MVLVHERQISRAARWSKSVAWFSGVLLVTAGLGHRFGLVETIAFFWVLGIVGALAITALALAAAGFSRLWNFGDRGGKDSTRGALIALVVLSPFLISGYRVFAYPRLNDISTDLADPPLLAVAARMRTGGMNIVGPIGAEAAAIQLEHYPQVTGRRYAMAADRVLEIVEQMVARRGWPLAGSDRRIDRDEPLPPEVTVEAAASTFVFAFPSDIAIRVADEGETSYVDMRSASRYGRHDLGDNAARITLFLDELDTEIALQAGVAAPEN